MPACVNVDVQKCEKLLRGWRKLDIARNASWEIDSDEEEDVIDFDTDEESDISDTELEELLGLGPVGV